MTVVGAGTEGVAGVVTLGGIPTAEVVAPDEEGGAAAVLDPLLLLSAKACGTSTGTLGGLAKSAAVTLSAGEGALSAGGAISGNVGSGVD